MTNVRKMSREQMRTEIDQGLVDAGRQGDVRLLRRLALASAEVDRMITAAAAPQPPAPVRTAPKLAPDPYRARRGPNRTVELDFDAYERLAADADAGLPSWARAPEA